MLPDDPANIAATPHLREAEEVPIAIARRMTAAQKIANIYALRQMAWDLQWIGMRRLHPELTDGQVHALVKERFFAWPRLIRSRSSQSR